MDVLLLPRILNNLDMSPCPVLVTAKINPVVAGTRTVTISNFAIGIHLGKKYDGKSSADMLFCISLWRMLEKIRCKRAISFS